MICKFVACLTNKNSRVMEYAQRYQRRIFLDIRELTFGSWLHNGLSSTSFG